MRANFTRPLERLRCFYLLISLVALLALYPYLTVEDGLDDPGFSALFSMVMLFGLYSVARNRRVRVKARVGEDACAIASLVALYASADWMEREVWDLYGVHFEGHPDLRRLLLYEEFEGHPLRKDYAKEKRQPLVGPRN